MTGPVLRNKYKRVDKIVKGWRLYEPNQQSLILVLEMNQAILQKLDQSDHFLIEASRGSAHLVFRDDFLVAPLDLGEIYRIAKTEFGESYEIATGAA